MDPVLQRKVNTQLLVWLGLSHGGVVEGDPVTLLWAADQAAVLDMLGLKTAES